MNDALFEKRKAAALRLRECIRDKGYTEFGVAMEEAMAAGVEVLFLKCHVEPDSLVIVD